MAFGPAKQIRKTRGTKKGCMKGKGSPKNSLCNYRGVRQRTWGKWVAEIREPNGGAQIWLGTYDTAQSAIFSYDNATLGLYGSDAYLNIFDAIRKPTQFKTGSACNDKPQFDVFTDDINGILIVTYPNFVK